MASKKRFSILGYGTVAYFNLLEHLIALFFILTLLGIPKMYLYSQYGENKLSTNFLDYVEIGNIGYASPQCAAIDFGVGTLQIDCPTGVIKSVESFGIIPDDARITDACLPNRETR
jgi:hypothetical protein